MNTYVRSIILIGMGLVVGFGAGFYAARTSDAALPTPASPTQAEVSTAAEQPAESPKLQEAKEKLAAMRRQGLTDQWPPAQMLIIRIRELEEQQLAQHPATPR